jgi:serine/threonine protein kinase
MPLSSGTRLGGYEILALLGAGGMGEVYRARDTRLNRDVALKILPAPMAGNHLAYERFQREARAVAALSHPNILSVHDVGQDGAASFVVFELLHGATLRERLADGPLPVRKAIDYARQTADGLAAAHERGITHRDIKPDNLFVSDDGRVKILDFGLAHAASMSGADETQTHAAITDAGTVMGTVGYMAPEQVRGQAVDSRADVFALGCVIYEMCSGQRAFKGATPADTMTAVLTSDPPVLVLTGQPTPPALDRIVRRCLEKAPAERFQSVRDLSFALDALSSLSVTASGAAPTLPSATRRWTLPAAVLAALAVGATAGRWWPSSNDRETQPAPAALHVEFDAPVRRTLPALLMAMSPDGRRLAYSDDARAIVVRDLSTGEVERIPDSANAFALSWSPRSDELLYFVTPEVRRFRLGERGATPIFRTAESVLGGVWLTDDTIILATGVGGLRRLPAAGGDGAPVVPGSTDLFRTPVALGARTDYILALSSTEGSASNRQVVAVRLSDGHVTPILPNEAGAVWIPGYLLLARPTGLYAAPFDERTLTVTGEVILAGEPVTWDAPSSMSSLAASPGGLVAFRPGRESLVQFEWVTSAGASMGVVGPPGFYGSFALSPDGTRIVARKISSVGSRTSSGLALIDEARGVSAPVPAPEGAISDPIWTADGSRILYRYNRTLVRQPPASSTHEVLQKEQIYPDDVSRDGRLLIAGAARPDGGFGLFVMPLDGSGPRQTIDEGEFSADEGSFSPDGRLISFHSRRTGRPEIYLARYPLTDERWQVSAEGGVQARWAGDGRTLYYIDLSGRLMRVSIQADRPDRFGRAEPMFDLGIGTPSVLLEQYAVHGDRFLVQRPVPNAAPQTIAVIGNWASLLPRRPAPQ